MPVTPYYYKTPYHLRTPTYSGHFFHSGKSHSGFARPHRPVSCSTIGHPRYLLRTNMTDSDPVRMWEYYLQLTEIEQIL
ncbi:MAG: hypothetical protein ACO3RV_06945 [Luteolibacter sp.]